MQAGLFHPDVDLGEEPPLVVYDERNQVPDRRQVSVRWLTGTVLTGLTSVVLMGGAMIAALDGQYTVAAAPARDAADTGADGLDLSTSRSVKGDRITRSATHFSNRQVIPVNTVTRIGDRDHIKAKPYVLVSTTLATRRSRTADDRIPPFNPLKLFNDTDVLPERAVSDAIYGAKVDGEVSISVRDFPVESPLIDVNLAPSEAEIESVVRQSARFLAANADSAAAYPIVDPGRFDFDLARQSEFSRLDVRITPENVSFVSKSADGDNFIGMEEKIIPIVAKRDFRELLLENEATEEEADMIVEAFATVYTVKELEEGQRLRIALNPADGSNRMRPERVSLYADTVHLATVARSDTGSFVKADAPTTFLADAFAEADRLGYSGPTPTLYESLYETALEQEVPEQVISDLIRTFSFDVDFKSNVKPGDSFEVFYALEDEDAEGPPEVLYAALTTGGTPRQFYRFRTPDDGVVDYYDKEGKSAKKFLMRKPLSGGKFRSGFGMRRHPILGYSKLHTGVDWAAPRGAPIMAAGDGVVEKAGWSSGYGQFTLLRHVNGYETAYGHQSAIAKGVVPGARVRQGQVIGYVGSTGLSTGPHVHYEVRINGNYVDPMRIRLPRGRVLEGDMLAAFERERDRIDALISHGVGPARVVTAAAR